MPPTFHEVTVTAYKPLSNKLIDQYLNRSRERTGYEVSFDEIWKKPSNAADMGITHAFARRLEAEIRAQPENWLWSRKRWKIRQADS